MDCIKERLQNFWEPSDLFRVPFTQAKEMEFADEDAHLLADLGLPDWAAPNLHLHFPSRYGNGRILIGEDRDGLPLIYDKQSRQVLARLSDNGDVLVATSLFDLLKLLIEYAEMVDNAILVNGASAYIENNVPNHLIDIFEGCVEKILRGANSVWSKELQRLRSHARLD